MNKFITASAALLYLTLVSFTVFETKIGEKNNYDEAYTALELNGGYLVSGAYNESGANHDWKSLIVFLDKNGDTVWTKKDLSVNGFVRKTNDGNLIFIGGNRAGLVYDSIRISKASEQGNIIWSQSFSFSNCRNSVTDIVETSDGFFVSGYFVSGTCNNPSNDAFVMKLDKSGNEEWVEFFGGQFDEQFHSVRVLPNGNVAAFGFTNSNTSNNLPDYLLAIYSSKGLLQQYETYGNNDRNFGYGMEVLQDGSMVLSGYSEKMEVICVGTDLKTLWKKTFNNSCGSTYFKVIKTNDGGLALTATENLNNECVSVFYKTDINGNVLWKKSFSGTIREFTETADGKFVMAGFADYLPNMYVVKFDSTTFQQTNTQPIVSDRFDNKPLNNLGDIDVDAFLQEMGITTKVDEEALNKKYPSVKLFPNPATEQINIEFYNPDTKPFRLEVYDLGGTLVMQQNNVNQSKIEIQRGWLSSGVYTYKLTGNANTHCGKFIFK